MSDDELPRWRRLQWQAELRRELQANREQVRRDVWLAWALALLDEAEAVVERLDCVAHALKVEDQIGHCHRLAREIARTRDRLLGFELDGDRT